MKTIKIIRENNYLTRFRPFKIYINDKFIDYIEPKEKSKVILIDAEQLALKIGVNNCHSNSVVIDTNTNTLTLNVTSQIQNGLFIFAFLAFAFSIIAFIFGVIQNIYILFALFIPYSIIVYWKTIGRNNFLRLTKSSYS